MKPFIAALRIALASIAAIFLLSIARPARAEFAPPPFTSSVVDQAGKLSEADRVSLVHQIERHRLATGFVVAVYLPASLDSETIEDVAYKTFNTWHLGDKAKDNAVLLVIAPNERRPRIETGKGTGGALTDLQTNIILHEDVGPLLKQERFREAIALGIDDIYAALAKDPAAGPVGRHRGQARGAEPVHLGTTGILLLLIPFGLFFLVMRAVSRMRYRGGYRDGWDTRGGGGGGPFIFPGPGGGFGGGGGWGGGGGSGGGGSDWGGGSSGDYSGGGSSGGGGSSDSY